MMTMKRVALALLGLLVLTGCSASHAEDNNAPPTWKIKDIANVREQCAHTYPGSVAFDGFDGQYAIYAWRDPVYGTRLAAVDTQSGDRWLETCGA